MLVFKLMLLPEPLKSLLAATFWELTTYFIPWSDLADRFLQEVRDEDLLLYWQDLITITVRLPMSKLSGAVCHRGPNPHCYVRDCSGHAQLWRQFVHCIPCSYLHNGSEEISEVTHNQTNAASLLLSQMEKDFHYKKLVGGGGEGRGGPFRDTWTWFFIFKYLKSFKSQVAAYLVSTKLGTVQSLQYSSSRAPAHKVKAYLRRKYI